MDFELVLRRPVEPAALIGQVSSGSPDVSVLGLGTSIWGLLLGLEQRRNMKLEN